MATDGVCRSGASMPSAVVRIVSLLPSATEILFALGLGEHVAGVTFECDHPAEARTKRIVSTSALPEGLSPAEIAVVKGRVAAGEDLYRLHAGAFADIDPDLVVTQDRFAGRSVTRSGPITTSERRTTGSLVDP